MIEWSAAQLKAAGINKRKLVSLIEQFEEVVDEMRAQGFTIYSASGVACLIHKSRPPFFPNANPDRDAVVAVIGDDGWVDGGDF